MVSYPAPDTLVAELLQDYPACLRVFLDHKMLCVGCHVAPFHTIDDACMEHGVEEAGFLEELARIVAHSAGKAGPA